MITKILFIFAIFTLSPLTAFAEKTPLISQSDLIKHLSTQHKKHKNSIIILDVRSAKEFSAGHIQDAINISHESIEENLALLTPHKDKMIVVHCRSGKRARSAEKALKAYGFNTVYHLDGDIIEWVKAELPLIK